MSTLKSKSKIVSINRKRKGTVSSQTRKRKYGDELYFVPEILLSGKWLQQLTGIGQNYHLTVDVEQNRLIL